MSIPGRGSVMQRHWGRRGGHGMENRRLTAGDGGKKGEHGRGEAKRWVILVK